MKKTLLWFASFLFLASLTIPTTLQADDLPPICNPQCGKPGMSLVAGLNR